MAVLTALSVVTLNQPREHILADFELAFLLQPFFHSILKYLSALASLLLFQLVPQGGCLRGEIGGARGSFGDNFGDDPPAGNSYRSKDRIHRLREGVGKRRRGTDRFDRALPVNLH